MRTGTRTLALACAFLSAASAAAQPKSPTVLPDGAVARLGQSRLRHAERPTCVAFAPDGRTFVSGGEDGTVRVWSVDTGELVRMAERPGTSVEGLAFTRGGTRLAVHYRTVETVQLLDALTLTPAPGAPPPSRGRFELSHDGALMATSGGPGLHVVETATDLPKLELDGVGAFAFRPDGKAVAVAYLSGEFAVHLVTGGKPVMRVPGTGAVTGFAFTPDGARLAVGLRAANGRDAVRVYAGTDPNPVAEIAGTRQPVGWVGRDALALVGNGDAGVYDLARKAWRGRVPASGAVAVSPDGSKIVATGSSGLRVRLWDVHTQKELHAENDAFPEPALLAGTADGRALFLIAGGFAYRWPLVGPAEVVGKFPRAATLAAARGGTLVVATTDGVLLYTGFDPAKPLTEMPTPLADSADATALAVSADGMRVAWAREGGAVTVTAVNGAGPVALPATTSRVQAIAFAPDGQKLAALGRDGFVRLWAVPAGGKPTELWKTRVGRGPRATLAFSPDGRALAVASMAAVPVFDATSGAERFRLDRYSDEGAAQHAAFSPDGRLLFLGSVGPTGRVEVWEMATRTLVRAFSSGYGGATQMGAFPDGTKLATAGAEEAVTVWDLAQGATAPKDSELAGVWTDLGAAEGSVGVPAVRKLAAAGDRGTDAIARAAGDLLVARRKIAEWVEDLGSKSFEVREAAAKALVAQGVRALPAVAEAARGTDPDVRDRAKEVLRAIEEGVPAPSPTPTGEQLRMLRAVHALELIGTARARAALADLSKLGGEPGAAADAALARVKK